MSTLRLSTVAAVCALGTVVCFVVGAVAMAVAWHWCGSAWASTTRARTSTFSWTMLKRIAAGDYRGRYEPVPETASIGRLATRIRCVATFR